MQNLVGIVRTGEELETAIGQLDALRGRAARVKVGGNIQYNPGWHLALDLKNMLDTSEAVARAALARTESRGAHTRDDFADSEAAWSRLNLIVRQDGGRIVASPSPLPEMPPELKQLLEEGPHD
jgi:succinate dehydrogenase / fumarate reductase flavoprotein subunit